MTVLPLLLALLAGCGGGKGPPKPSSATPPARTTTATPIDVCDLVPTETVAQLLERPLSVVGRSVGAPRNSTVDCQLGQLFATPLVTVTLSPDPIAADVFDAAYGDRAGGNPALIKNLGDKAYVRTEDTNRVLHVYANGAVLSVSVVFGQPGSDDAISMVQLIRLTRAAVKALPDNPVVVTRTSPRPCHEIDPTVLAATLGRPPTLDTGLTVGDGAIMCSWSGQPGSVTLTLTDDPLAVQRYLQAHPIDQSVAVAGVIRPADGRALSSPNDAGDLVVLVGTDRLMTVEVIPAAGYADDGIDTSDDERRVAEAGLALFDDLG